MLTRTWQITSDVDPSQSLVITMVQGQLTMIYRLNGQASQPFTLDQVGQDDLRAAALEALAVPSQ